MKTHQWSLRIAVCLSMLVPGRVSGLDAKTPPGSTSVVVTQADESRFPEISIYFEVKNPDGSYRLDARRQDFHVSEDGEDHPIEAFEAPETVITRPTTLVLVVDRSGSMRQDNRIGGLKQAVTRFLDGLPRGSRVAVIAFGFEVSLIQPFTNDTSKVQRAVDDLEAIGSTRYYDAVHQALELFGPETGRRAILALTDGADTNSRQASLKSVIEESRRLGVPVHTLELGTGSDTSSATLSLLAKETQGQAYSARDTDQLSAIYEEIARKLGSSYRLTYRTDRPDGTLRAIRVYHSQATQAGESAVFIRGMVAHVPGWPALFLALLGGLGVIAVLPGRIAAWTRRG